MNLNLKVENLIFLSEFQPISRLSLCVRNSTNLSFLLTTLKHLLLLHLLLLLLLPLVDPALMVGHTCALCAEILRVVPNGIDFGCRDGLIESIGS